MAKLELMVGAAVMGLKASKVGWFTADELLGEASLG
jgi:hypothetical protein